MRLVVVSNRLPVIFESDKDGWRSRPGGGGLVRALSPVMGRHGGLWIGWPGHAEANDLEMERLLASAGTELGCSMKPVTMTEEEVAGFYQGYSNEIIWPLFHDLQTLCNFDPDYWVQYQSVEEKFANVVLNNTSPGDFLWIHDFHLLGLARRIRSKGFKERIGFFLHIPFPPPDIFCKLPWRSQVLEGMLHSDLIGFQSSRHRENFLDCIRRLMPQVRLARSASMIECTFENHTARVGVFPIGVDYNQFADAADSAEITSRVKTIRNDLPGRQIVLGVDRLDHTKGIPYRLRAFELAMQRYPELHRKVSLLQVVVPSRESVPKYQELKADIEQEVSRINGEFTQPGWVPIHHVFRSLEWEDLVSYYRAADVALVTPLKDGMNLVAKEYCACQSEENGVLILSEFAGAAMQMKRDALLVNPCDIEGVAKAIHTAVTMSTADRRPLMRHLRGVVRREDVYWWLDRFLEAGGVAMPNTESHEEHKLATAWL